MDAIEHGNTAYNVRLPTRGFALEFGGGEGMPYDDQVSEANRARRFHMTAALKHFMPLGHFAAFCIVSSPICSRIDSTVAAAAHNTIGIRYHLCDRVYAHMTDLAMSCRATPACRALSMQRRRQTPLIRTCPRISRCQTTRITRLVAQAVTARCRGHHLRCQSQK